MKALDPQRKTVGAAFQAGFHFALVKIAQATFNGDFAVIGQGEDPAHGLKQSQHVRGRKLRRRAAAQIDGMHRPAFNGCAAAPQPQLGDERVSVAGALVLPPGLGIKPAIQAMTAAKGNVDIGHGFSGSLFRQQRIHMALHVGGRNPAPPKAGMNGYLALKGVGERRHAFPRKKPLNRGRRFPFAHKRRHIAHAHHLLVLHCRHLSSPPAGTDGLARPVSFPNQSISPR